jgi:hypothetical protein
VVESGYKTPSKRLIFKNPCDTVAAMINTCGTDSVTLESCQWFEREWKFVSLMEILRLYADQYCHLASHAQLVCILVDKIDESVRAKVSAEIEVECLWPTVREMKQESERIGLTATRDACARILQRWEIFHSYRETGELCRELLRILDSEFKSKICFVLPPTSQTLYDDPFKGWEEILAVFPDARDDVEQMRRCEAFGCYSAAVFHVLLAVEFSVIALGRFVGVSDHKPGWDATCIAVEKILQGGRKSAPPDVVRYFGFLELVNKDMQSMKMAWRNKVSHAANNLRLMTSDFKPEVANKIITAAHGFMLLIATEGPLGATAGATISQ